VSCAVTVSATCELIAVGKLRRDTVSLRVRGGGRHFKKPG
jgi:hypothetical protein